MKTNIAVILLFIFLHCGAGFSQQEQYRFEHIGKKDGLASDRTRSIFKDSWNFVWIGTQFGLNRYDGYSFKTYIRTDDTTSISNDWPLAIIEDNNKSLWVGTWNGLNLYNRHLDNFTRFLFNPDDSLSQSHNNINSICQDENNIFWLGTWGGGLIRFDSGLQLFTQYKQRPNESINDLDKIYSVYQDHEKNLWIGTKRGVFIFDREKKEFRDTDLNSLLSETQKKISCIVQDNKNNLYFGSSGGLIIYDKSSQTHTFLYQQHHELVFGESNEKERSSITTMLINGNVLWLASSPGLDVYNIESGHLSHLFSDPGNPYSISSNSVNDFYLGNQGDLWIATATEGINVLNTKRNKFHHVLLNKNIGESFTVQAICLAKNGELWVGAYKGGLFRFDGDMNMIGHYEPELIASLENESLSSRNIFEIYEDSKEQLWVNIHLVGLTIFDRNEEVFRPIPYSPNLPENTESYFTKIVEDRRGRIWFGSTNGLYLKENPESAIKRIDHEPLGQTQIRFIKEDSKFNIWVGTVINGLYCLAPENYDSMIFNCYGNIIEDTNGYYGDFINMLYEDVNNNIWLTTYGGLNFFNQDKNKFEIFEQNEFLYGDQITNIFGDNTGNLWLFNFKHGLIRYNPYSKDSRSIKVFTMNDGLPFENISPFYGSFQSSDGSIFVSGTGANGFFSFHPDSIKNNTRIPQLVITDFKVKNDVFPLDTNIIEIKNIYLKHDQNYFSFEFAALDYTNPEKNQYAYYLEGLEEDWIYSGTRRFASYTGVPPGDYTFRVKGSNNDGYWNEEGTYVHISISPPYWKTWWAYTLYILFIAGLIYSIRKYELKRQRLKQDLELEQVEAVKLKELDTMKSKFFANISHEFRTPLTLILGPIDKIKTQVADEVKKDLEIMQRNARRLQNLINQLLNLSRLESGRMKLAAREENIVELVNGYAQSFESLAKQKKIKYAFKSSEKEIMLFADKDKIQKILFNLLSNAFKFTGEGGEIKVEVTPLNPPSRGETHALSPLEGGRGVTIKISDTGRGIPPNQLQHIFDRFYQTDDSYSKDQEGSGIGLALTKELVELHHGEIKVESVVGKGTTFIVILPEGKGHFKPGEIINTSCPEVSEDKIAGLVEPDNLDEQEQPLVELHDQVEITDDITDEDDPKPLLLIVEDNDDLRSYIRSCLPDEYRISEAIDGEMGLEKAIEKIPDLILSDVMMPKMDGMQLCQKIKTDERTSHIPVILLTAKAGLENKLEGLETGADDFISKPFEVDELLIRIKNLIDQRRKLRELFSQKITSPESFVQKLQDSIISSTDQKFLHKANEVVEECMQDYDFGAELFSSKMNMSRMQLHRKLKAIVNQSAGDFIRTIRLNRAASLLQAEFGNVTEVSLEVGFNNLSWFTKCFKEQFGVIPSEYNKNNFKA